MEEAPASSRDESGGESQNRDVKPKCLVFKLDPTCTDGVRARVIDAFRLGARPLKERLLRNWVAAAEEERFFRPRYVYCSALRLEPFDVEDVR